MAALHQLVRYGIEAISFLTLMIDYRFPNIIASMSEDNVTAIKTLTLESLITTQEGRTVGKALMTALVNHQIRDEMGVDAISQILHQRCPSICEPDDVILYKGMELLQSVTGVTNSDQREKILVEAQE